MHLHIGNHLLAGLIIVILSACVVRGPLPPSSSAIQGAPPTLKPGDIVETQTGKTISFDALLDRLTNVQIIYVGETHTNMEDHGVQLEIMRGLYDRNPSIVLAMEMFPREVQPVLDRYSKGTITESEMIEETAWKKVWGYPFQLYQNLLSFARDNHLPILALNAPPEIVRKVSRNGLVSLTLEERNQVARDFHLDDPKHREYILKEYAQHVKSSIKDFETFYEAQLTWEETMAETLAQELATFRNGEQILVLIGRGHISDHVGVPRLALLRGEHIFKTIIPVPVSDSVEAMDQRIGDYLWITKEPEPLHRGRLGVMVRPAATGEGLEILAIIPGSPAAKAGVQKGDILYLFDGNPINSLEELLKAIEKKAPTHRLGIKRNQEEISLDVAISY